MPTILATTSRPNEANGMCRSFHPTGQPPQPLDAICDINPNASCATKDGPIVRVVVQQHPLDEERCIALIVIENYVSKQFLKQVEDGGNRAKFRAQKNGTYLREATKVSKEYADETAKSKDRMRPVHVHGSKPNSKGFECCYGVMGYEDANLKMTTWCHKVMDKVYGEMLDGIAGVLSREKGGTTPTAREFVSYTESEFVLPIAPPDDPPHDAPDSCMSQASLHHSFGSHSDADDKPDNVNPEICFAHPEMLRIATPCYLIRKKGVQPSYPAATIQHGIPEPGGKLKMFRRIGDFCCNPKKGPIFQRVKGSRGIPFGGDSHMHIQPMGSQPGIHHHIGPGSNQQSDEIRLVCSSRPMVRLQPSGMSTDVCLERGPLLTKQLELDYFGKEIPIHSWEGHNTDRIFHRMLGNNYDKAPNKAGWFHEDATLNLRGGGGVGYPLEDDESSTDKATEDCDEKEQESSDDDDTAVAESGDGDETAPCNDAVVADTTETGVAGGNVERELVVPRLPNSKLLSCEEPIQHHTKGAPNKVTVDMLPQSVHTARPLYERNISAVFNRGNKPSVIVGPLALDSEKGLRLAKPGEVLHDDVIYGTKLGIPRDNKYKKISNVNRRDVIRIWHWGKNSMQLCQYMVDINSKKRPCRPSGFFVCDAGGIALKSDHNNRSVADPNSKKNGATHLLAVFQDPETLFIKEMRWKSLLGHTVLLMYQNIYLGCFEIMGVSNDNTEYRKDPDLYKKELHHMEKLLPHLHKLYPAQFPSGTVTPEDSSYASAWRTKRQKIFLWPLIQDPLERWEGRDDHVLWTQLQFDISHFRMPFRVCPKDETVASVADCLNEDVAQIVEDLFRLSNVSENPS